MSKCMNELESAFYKAWLEAGQRQFATVTNQAHTLAEVLEAMAEEAEAHARYLRIKLAIRQVREVKEGTSHEAE